MTNADNNEPTGIEDVYCTGSIYIVLLNIFAKRPILVRHETPLLICLHTG